MSAGQDVQRQRYLFHGRVQGVSFRWTTERIARRFMVDGYVRNQPDGTVEVVVSGRHAQIADFIRDIHDAFSGHIKSLDCEPLETDEVFQGFRIRY